MNEEEYERYERFHMKQLARLMCMTLLCTKDTEQHYNEVVLPRIDKEFEALDKIWKQKGS